MIAFEWMNQIVRSRTLVIREKTRNIKHSVIFFVSLHGISCVECERMWKITFKTQMHVWRKEHCRNAFFAGFYSEKGLLGAKTAKKLQILQKKSGKCFVVKKKAIPLHSLYNGNSATNDDRLFSSVGQST